jgi:hypothetical protein
LKTSRLSKELDGKEFWGKSFQESIEGNISNRTDATSITLFFAISRAQSMMPDSAGLVARQKLRTLQKIKLAGNNLNTLIARGDCCHYNAPLPEM